MTNSSQLHSNFLWSAQGLTHSSFVSGHSRFPGLDDYGDYRPARGVSGDYLDYLELPEGDLAVVVGDIAGHALSPTVFISFLRAIARDPTPSRLQSLSHLATRLHEKFYEICPEGSYATLFATRYDSTKGTLYYVNAGHEPPLLLRKSPHGYRATILEPTGPVIGVLRRAIFREYIVSVGPGDLLAAYTDGLCETMNAKGEPWGYRRMLEALKAASYRKPRDIVEQVLEAAESFAGGSTQHDDRTLWVCRVEDSRSATFTLSESIELEAVA